jgi:uncharacterized protein YndB with AHSA1/START domain
MTELPHQLDRTVVIRAKRETVFRYFTDNARWAAWWGAGSTIEPRPGGKVFIMQPGGVETLGEVLEVSSPERIVFTYGFASGKPIPPGSSRVTIRLQEDPAGTRLHLTHEFAEPSARDEHIQGWRFQLSLFANVVLNEVHAGAAGLVDGWFTAWSIAGEEERLRALSAIASPSVGFRDRFSLLDGMADVSAHIAASLRFMPGIRLERRGDIRQCQGTILADWVAQAADGQQRGAGTNVFELGSDGRIQSVTGFWN